MSNRVSKRVSIAKRKGKIKSGCANRTCQTGKYPGNNSSQVSELDYITLHYLGELELHYLGAVKWHFQG